MLELSKGTQLAERYTLERPLGRGGEAQATQRRALALAPRNPQLHLNLGVILEGAGRLEEARGVIRSSANPT